MSGAEAVRANSVALPLGDETVDLIVTSPPYFALRSYRDGGEHYAGQVGSEATPQAFLEALWAVTAECWRVLKPTGSLFVNLGDKRSGSGGHNNSGISPKSTLSGNGHVGGVGKAGPQKIKATLRNAPDRYNQAAFGRPKSKMLLPHRYAIGCEDGLADPDGVGWIVRQDVVWSKVNGLPESVTDRTRDSHEYVFHLTKQGRYFSAVDEVREPSSGYVRPNGAARATPVGQRPRAIADCVNPLGKLPGSVWPMPSEPLVLSDAVKAHYDLPDHFAAFPQELPRRIILGWSPSGVCTACGEGRRPTVATTLEGTGHTNRRKGSGKRDHNEWDGNDRGFNAKGYPVGRTVATITGYACACPDASAPTRRAVVCDVFGGTGTVAGVARALGRFGISFDLSHDYGRLARYFLTEGRGRFAKTSSRTDRERQQVLL